MGSHTRPLLRAWCFFISDISNCVMHSTTIEMCSRLLLDDLFGSSVAIGYSVRRVVNVSVCLLATLLYSLSEYAVYQAVALFYALSVPVSFYFLASYLKCMPWQKREVILDKEPEKDKKLFLDLTESSASRNEIDLGLGKGEGSEYLDNTSVYSC
mmetsp:Transcript_23388/g.35441  ORF Transcript_23388/g.35441 Transcript_23388/m.35441 type:complete len:155 (+) Transcript_23388:78-542(+)